MPRSSDIDATASSCVETPPLLSDSADLSMTECVTVPAEIRPNCQTALTIA